MYDCAPYDFPKKLFSQNAAYVVVDGARKKVEEWNAEDTEVIQLQGRYCVDQDMP